MDTVYSVDVMLSLAGKEEMILSSPLPYAEIFTTKHLLMIASQLRLNVVCQKHL